MKSIIETITESNNLSFDLRNDIYTVLSDLAFEYDQKNKNFDESDVREALDNFMVKFFDSDK